MGAALALIALALPAAAQDVRTLPEEDWRELAAILREEAEAFPEEELASLLEDCRGVDDARCAEVRALAGCALADRLEGRAEDEERWLEAACWCAEASAAAPTDASTARVLRYASRLTGLGAFERLDAELTRLLALYPPTHYHKNYLYLALATAALEHRALDRAQEVLAEQEAFGALHGNDESGWIADTLRANLDILYGRIGEALERLDGAIAGLDGLHTASADPNRYAGQLCNAYSVRLLALQALERDATVVEEVRRLLAERADLYAARPAARAHLERFAAQGLEILSYGDPALVPEARGWLARVLEEPAVRADDARWAALSLARLEAEHGGAARVPELLRRARAGARLSPREESFALAVEARLALADGAPREALAELLQRMEPAVERVLAQVEAAPLSEAGFDFLTNRSYRTALGRLMELHLAVDPEQGPRAALRVVLAHQARSTLARTLELSAVDLPEVVEALLPSGHGLYVFFPMEEEPSFVFALDRGAARCARVPSHRELLPRVRALLAELRTSPEGLEPRARTQRRERLDAAAAELAARLFPAALREAVRAWSSVSVVGRDTLDALPFEALPVLSEQPLGLERAVVHVPSLALAVRDARARDAAGPLAPQTLALRLVLPGGAPGRELPLDPAQRRRLLDPFPAARVAALDGAAATPAAVLDPAAAPSTVLHVLAHGVSDPARTRSRGLELQPFEGDRGRLFPDALGSVSVPARLVVLSACSSGAGPERQGDPEAATLPGAFLRAGVWSVVASSSELGLDPTVELAGAFQEALAQGIAPGEALRRARVHLVEAGWDDPYYFTGVHLVGLDRPLFPPPEPRSSRLLLAGALGAVAAAGWLAARRGRG